MSITAAVRTTVTLDEDVLARVKAYSKQKDVSFRDALNDLIRIGLLAEKEPAVKHFQLPKAHPMGQRPGINYDSTEELLSFAEGEAHR
jgi:hypothetical protein